MIRRPDVYRPARQFGASGGALSGMGAVGRVFTGVRRPSCGILHDASGSWYLPLSGVTVLAIIMAIFGLHADAIER